MEFKILYFFTKSNSILKTTRKNRVGPRKRPRQHSSNKHERLKIKKLFSIEGSISPRSQIIFNLQSLKCFLMFSLDHTPIFSEKAFPKKKLKKKL